MYGGGGDDDGSPFRKRSKMRSGSRDGSGSPGVDELGSPVRKLNKRSPGQKSEDTDDILVMSDFVNSDDEYKHPSNFLDDNLYGKMKGNIDVESKIIIIETLENFT